MRGQIVGYARVSSTSQNLARQLEALGAVDELFTDHQSGKNRADRAGLADALRYVRRGDTLRVASMDRLARSLIDLEQIVSDLTARKVSVEFVKERLTFTPDAAADPFATFQRQLIGAVAELERSLIRERQREGIDLAKARGVYKGRARRLSDEQVLYVRRAAAAGEAKSKLATDLGVSRRLVYDVLSGSGAYARPPVQPRPPLPDGEEVPLPLTLEALLPPAAAAEVADDEPSRHAVESSARESQRAPRGGE
ncbi:recombinase family protein [Dermacoccus sp. NHGro5]|nr:recombinase family protein [Dermacoccus sp. NHGro5]